MLPKGYMTGKRREKQEGLQALLMVVAVALVAIIAMIYSSGSILGRAPIKDYSNENRAGLATASPTYTINVDTTKVIAQIDNKLYGQNIFMGPMSMLVFMEDINDYDNSRLTALTDAINPGVLRYPGGVHSDFFYWARRQPNNWVKYRYTWETINSTSIDNGRVKVVGDAKTDYYFVRQFLNPSDLTPGVKYNLSANVEGWSISLSQESWHVKGLQIIIYYSDGTTSSASKIYVGNGTTPNRKMSNNFTYSPTAGKTVKWIELRAGLQYGTGTILVDNISLVNVQGGNELVSDGGFSGVWWPPAPYLDIITPSDIDAFMRFARAVDAEPMITINVGAYPWGDSRDAENRQRQADLVKYMNIEKGYDVKYWQMGNEPEVWRYRWIERLGKNPTENDSQKYAARFGEYYSAIKAVDSSIEVLSPGSLVDELTSALMSNQRSKVNILDVHHYRFSAEPTDVINQLLKFDGDENYTYLNYETDLKGFEIRLDSLKSLANTYNSNAKLSLSEYGACGSQCPTINGAFADAIWTANMLGMMANHDVELSTRWWLFGDIGGMITSKNKPRSPYYTFFLFANHYGTKVLNLTASFSPYELNVSAFSSKSDDGNKIYLLIVNRGPANKALSINLNGFNRPNLKGEAYLLTAPRLNDTEGANINGVQINPDNVTSSIAAIQPVTFDITGQSFIYTFPAYSVTAIEVSTKTDCTNGQTRNCTATNSCAGTQTCSAGVWGACISNQNYCDSNCDGTPETCSSTPCAACGCVSGSKASCYTGATGTLNIGLCHNGTKTCIAGVWDSCVGQVTPVTDICDNLDNDCDGTKDEGLFNSTGCLQLGLCSGSNKTCTAGGWGACSKLPQAEVCDNLDNDCDSVKDESLFNITGCNQIGVCLGSNKTCAAGVWGICSKLPQTETCDNKDNNCDGSVDESCACTDGATKTCGSNIGECRNGTQTCISGTWGTCVGSKDSANELCDNLDNDCDGATDEIFTNKNQACSIGIGECRSAGIYICAQNKTGTVCDATVINPSIEVCDAGLLDEDCDGTSNENCACTTGQKRTCGSSIGTCKPGNQTCTAGQWGSCIGEVTPADETCDSKDNNCDGTTDEGCTCTAGIERSCETQEGCLGIQNCTEGVWVDCMIKGYYCDSDCDGELECSSTDCDECAEECNETMACGEYGECINKVKTRTCTITNCTAEYEITTAASCGSTGGGGGGGSGGGGWVEPEPEPTAPEEPVTEGYDSSTALNPIETTEASAEISSQQGDGTAYGEEAAERTSAEETVTGTGEAGKAGILPVILIILAGIILLGGIAASTMIIIPKMRNHESLVTYTRYQLKKKYTKEQIISDLTSKNIPRKEIESVLKEAMIDNYYSDQKAAGKTKEQVEQDLERAGWDEKTVKKDLKKEK
ncbi:MAG: MopE-related protein [archaeon]